LTCVRCSVRVILEQAGVGGAGMDVRNLKPGKEFRAQVNELSGLAGRGQTVPNGKDLLAVGDESTDLFAMTRGSQGSGLSTVAWATAYAAPPDSGSNFEGVAADGHGHVVVLTEFPAGLVLLDMASLANERFMAYTRVRFDEGSMRERADIEESRFLQPEGVVLLREGHIFVAHEKKPRGLFELGPPGDDALGASPRSYLPKAVAFMLPPQLEALAWWPVTDHLDDVSDLAEWNDQLYFLSDQSGRIARLAAKDLAPGDDIEFDAIWKLPAHMDNAEGLIFTDDGSLYVGLDVDLVKRPDQTNVVMFPGLP
jgi:uncharacterized protein YjiK